MQKAIYIENTGKNVERVLSIADPSIIENNPTGLEYIIIEDYTEPPTVADPALDINYPMYDKINRAFKWITVHYQNTATETYLAIESVKSDIQTAKKGIEDIDNQINPKPNTFEEMKNFKQADNNKVLADFLDANPILWTDGEYYGVTQEDQNELALNLNQYQLTVSAGQESVLQWHPKHKACRDFTLEEFTSLILAIKSFVYPYVQHCQDIKTQIYSAINEEELNSIIIEYKLPETE